MSTITEPLRGTITNECTCTTVNDYGIEVPAMWDECDGHCWQRQVDDLDNCVTHLMQACNGWWHVDGIPMWDGTTQAGYFHAEETATLARKMGVNGAWRAEWEARDNELVYVLYHHDAPTGGTVTLTPFTGDQEPSKDKP